ncbi:MAG: efflux RND transporter periplasmic adaptor subunit, partial [candidate division Zixibacteria bacterium]|nr:efflux RND transporter periplasmic adaptor subunit [candidate division Zixibacteria bacterium]
MRKKRWIIGAGVVVVAAGGLFAALSREEEVAASQYRMAKIDRGDITMSVTATGTLKAVQTVQVGSQISGTVAQLYADFNSFVQAGQVVAQIDPTFLQAQVTEAEANLERSQATVSEAKSNLDRVNALLEQKYVSEAELDQRKAAYQSALAGRKQTEAALERARVNLKYATIRTPISGVVISRDVEIGQTVAASLQAPTLFSIANDLSKMQLETNIDEADIGKIQEGQTVTFTVDAYPDNQFEGRVAQIRLAPVTVQNVVTYTVILDVPNPELKLRPGMTANVSILIDQRFGVLRVPSVALRFRPSMGGGMMAAQQKPADTSLWGRVKGWFSGEAKPDSAAKTTVATATQPSEGSADSVMNKISGVGASGAEENRMAAASGAGRGGMQGQGGPGGMGGGMMGGGGMQGMQGQGRPGSGTMGESGGGMGGGMMGGPPGMQDMQGQGGPGGMMGGPPGPDWNPSPEMLARMRERMGAGPEVPDSVLIAQMRERMAQRGMGGGQGGPGMQGQGGMMGGGPGMGGGTMPQGRQDAMMQGGGRMMAQGGQGRGMQQGMGGGRAMQ